MDRTNGEIKASLRRIESMLSDVLDRIRPLATPPAHLSLAEVANLVDRVEKTVREWCKLGRINAWKRRKKDSEQFTWHIEPREIERYRRDDLLEIQSDRNKNHWLN